jgi:hypothetical protein
MTIDDLKMPLFTFFSKNEIFDLEDNYKEIIPFESLEEPDVKKAVAILALKEFEKQGLITEVPSLKPDALKNPDERKWILNKDLTKYEQPIELHYPTLAAIVKIINDFCEKSGDDQNKVDPLLITEKNIQDLCLLASQFVNPQKNSQENS